MTNHYGVGVGVASGCFLYVKTQVALAGHVAVMCAGPSITTCLINSGDEVDLINAAVSTVLGGGVGVGVGVAVGVGLGVGVGLEVGVGVVEAGVGVGVGVEVGVAVGVAAAAITTPRVLPPSCVKL